MPARKNRPDKYRGRPVVTAPRPGWTRQPSEHQGRYLHRGLPCCDPQGRQMAWCIVGIEVTPPSPWDPDAMSGVGAGVLEWCYDEEDAISLMTVMKRYPHQFQDLQAHPWQHTGEKRVKDLLGF